MARSRSSKVVYGPVTAYFDDSSEAALIREVIEAVEAAQLSGATLNRSTETGTTTLTNTQTLVGVSLSSAATITLANPSTMSEGQQVILKDESGNFGTYNLVIDVSGGGTIDGNASVTLNVDHTSITLYTDGSNYYIL